MVGFGRNCRKEELKYFHNNVKTLYEEYGPIYSIRYLENSAALLHIDRVRIKSISDSINQILIQSLLNYYSIEELVEELLAGEIQEAYGYEDAYFPFCYVTGKHYIELKGIPLFFKIGEETEKAKELLEDVKYIKQLKLNSQFYQQLKNTSTTK